MKKIRIAGNKKAQAEKKASAVKKPVKSAKPKSPKDIIKASLLLLEKIKNNIAEPFCAINKDGFIVQVNEPLLKLLGADKKKLIGKPAAFLYPGSEESLDEFKKKFKSSNFPKSIETRITAGGNKTLHVKEENLLLSAGIGKLLFKKFKLLSKDEEKNSGMKLLQSLLNSSSDPAFIFDEKFNIINGNKKLASLMGLPDMQKIAGNNIALYIKKTDQKRIAEAFAAEELQDAYFTVVSRFGDEIPAQISLSPVDLKEEGKFYFGFIKDQSKSMQAEETIKYFHAGIKELNKSKEKLFNVISHDLRSPYQGLISAAELLRKNSDELSREEIVEFSVELERTLRNQYELLNNLFEWSRIERGELSFEPRRSNLRNLVQQTAEALRIKAEEKRISLENNIDDNLELNVDDSAFKIVLQNLYSNAIKFTPAGGKVSVFAKDKGAETQISVLDTGVGIPMENLKKLFRSDYAYSLPGTQNEPGTGLGLILCRELVTSFGGKIWAESSEGEGSVFSFTIPKRK